MITVSLKDKMIKVSLEDKRIKQYKKGYQILVVDGVWYDYNEIRIFTKFS